MPGLFEMRKADSAFQLRGTRLSLPGVNCPACGTWAGTGIDYPLARLAPKADPAPFEDPSPVSVEEYRRRAAVVEGVPHGCVLEPGSEIGPLAGSVRGTVHDINFAFLWTAVLLRSAFDGLREEGLDLIGAPVLVRSARFDLIEVQIEPHARIPASSVPGGVYPIPCPVCGRLDVEVPKPIVLDGRTIPQGTDIFRGVDLSTFIFVTERFLGGPRTAQAAGCPLHACWSRIACRCERWGTPTWMEPGPMNSSKHYFLLKRGKYSFELHGHRSSLPGVTCPSCGVWAGTGINYPLAGLADGAPRALLDDVSPVPLEEYRRRASLVVGVPEGCVLGPGSGVGPFRGSVRGTVRDINIGFFNLVLKRHAFDALREEGLGLVGAPLQLRGAKHDLVEVQVEPRARLPAICFPDGRYPAVCPTCGRISIVVPDAVVLDRASLPREKDVFRGIDASTHIFVTDRFRMACMKLGLSGMIFHPVAVA